MAVGTDDRCGSEKLWAEIAVGFSSSVWSKKTVDFDIDFDFDIDIDVDLGVDFDFGCDDERESHAVE